MKFGKKKYAAQNIPAPPDNLKKETSGKGSPEKQPTSPNQKEVEIKPVGAEKPQEKFIKPNSGSISLKILLIGLPLFIIQVVVVYFITANILMSKSASDVKKDAQETLTAPEDSLINAELGKHIFLIEDIIVNPAGSEGERLLLTSLGFDTNDEESQKELKSKEVLLKDIIITTFSSKTWDQLNTSSFKDSLKIELSERITRLIPSVKLNTVYFSKYIAQ